MPKLTEEEKLQEEEKRKADEKARKIAEALAAERRFRKAKTPKVRGEIPAAEPFLTQEPVEALTATQDMGTASGELPPLPPPSPEVKSFDEAIRSEEDMKFIEEHGLPEWVRYREGGRETKRAAGASRRDVEALDAEMRKLASYGERPGAASKALGIATGGISHLIGGGPLRERAFREQKEALEKSFWDRRKRDLDLRDAVNKFRSTRVAKALPESQLSDLAAVKHLPSYLGEYFNTLKNPNGTPYDWSHGLFPSDPKDRAAYVSGLQKRVAGGDSDAAVEVKTLADRLRAMKASYDTQKKHNREDDVKFAADKQKAYENLGKQYYDAERGIVDFEDMPPQVRATFFTGGMPNIAHWYASVGAGAVAADLTDDLRKQIANYKGAAKHLHNEIALFSGVGEQDTHAWWRSLDEASKAYRTSPNALAQDALLRDELQLYRKRYGQTLPYVIDAEKRIAASQNLLTKAREQGNVAAVRKAQQQLAEAKTDKALTLAEVQEANRKWLSDEQRGISEEDRVATAEMAIARKNVEKFREFVHLLDDEEEHKDREKIYEKMFFEEGITPTGKKYKKVKNVFKPWLPTFFTSVPSGTQDKIVINVGQHGNERSVLYSKPSKFGVDRTIGGVGGDRKDITPPDKEQWNWSKYDRNPEEITPAQQKIMDSVRNEYGLAVIPLGGLGDAERKQIEGMAVGQRFKLGDVTYKRVEGGIIKDEGK